MPQPIQVTGHLNRSILFFGRLGKRPAHYVLAAMFAAMFAAMLLIGPVQAQIGAPGSNVDATQILDELQQLIDEGDRTGAADPSFLNSLRDLVRRFNWPWQRLLLSDDFSDGNFTFNPSWQNLGGSAFVDPNFGLVMQTSSTVVESPPIFVPPSGPAFPGRRGGGRRGTTILSTADAWDGALDHFGFPVNGEINNLGVGAGGETIEIGPATIIIGGGGASGGGIRSREAFAGNFSFRIAAGIQSGVRVGLFAVSNDSQFRPTVLPRRAGTSGLRTMGNSWWLDEVGRVMNGPTQVAAIRIDADDSVTFRRTGATIELLVNDRVAHVFANGSNEPLRSVVNYASSQNFVLRGVSWTFPGGGFGPGPGGITPPFGGSFTPSSAQTWLGSVGNFLFNADSIAGAVPRRAIASSEVFAGDFIFRVTLGGTHTTGRLRFGLFDANEDFRFDPRDPDGDLERMANSWRFGVGGLSFTNVSVLSGIQVGPGATLAFQRRGSQISFLVDGQAIHIFTQQSSAPLRVMLARDAGAAGQIVLDNVGWNVGGGGIPAPGGGGGRGGGGRTVEQDVVLEVPVFVTNGFAVEVILIAQTRRRSRFEFGVLRRRNGSGYHVEIAPGRSQRLDLVRTDRRGNETVIGQAEGVGSLNDGQPHSILMTRDASGNMVVAVDNAAWINVFDPDSGIPFSAISLADRRGEFIVTSVNVFGL